MKRQVSSWLGGLGVKSVLVFNTDLSIHSINFD